MQHCRQCGTRLDGAGGCGCSGLPAEGTGGRLRTDGGREDPPSGEEGDHHPPEQGQRTPAERQGQQPPHWERQGQRPDSGQGGGHQQPRQAGAGGGQPPDGRHQQPRQAGAGGGQPPEGAHPRGGQRGTGPAEEGETLSRRTLLLGGAGAAALAAGGWWAFLRGSDGPEAAVAAYLDAVDDADFDGVRNAIHDDGPIADTFDGTQEEFEQQVGGLSIEVDALAKFAEERDVQEPNVQRFASVFTALTVRPSEDAESGEQPSEPDQTTQITKVALTPGGDWKIWEREFI